VNFAEHRLICVAHLQLTGKASSLGCGRLAEEGAIDGRSFWHIQEGLLYGGTGLPTSLAAEYEQIQPPIGTRANYICAKGTVQARDHMGNFLAYALTHCGASLAQGEYLDQRDDDIGADSVVMKSASEMKDPRARRTGGRKSMNFVARFTISHLVISIPPERSWASHKVQR